MGLFVVAADDRPVLQIQPLLERSKSRFDPVDSVVAWITTGAFRRTHHGRRGNGN